MTSLPVDTTVAPRSTSASRTSDRDIDPRAARPAANVDPATSRTVLDVLRQAFAAELNGHCIPDDDLVAWLHDNHNLRTVTS